MKCSPWFCFRAAAAGIAVALVLVCAGCLEKRVVWSPDGGHAAVIGEAGLYLCDGDGRLSALQLPQARVVAWFGDSRRLAVARGRETGAWPEVAAALGEERAPVERQAETLWAELAKGGAWSALTENLREGGDSVKLCLRSVHGDELKQRLTPGDWAELEQCRVRLFDLLVGQVEGERVTFGAARHTGVRSVADLRPSPDGRMLAFTRERASDSDNVDLWVLEIDGSAAPVPVGERACGYPDWTPDGQALVYLLAQPATAKETPAFGMLVRRTVLDAQGRIALAEKPEELVGMGFNVLAHVRCLRDGRILFNAPEINLPAAVGDFDGSLREQLFAVDPGRVATLVRLIPRRTELELPQSLSFFEVSPDETQVVFGSAKGEVALLTLATGDVTRIQDGSQQQYQGVPVWRRASEFSYVRRTALKPGETTARPAEIVLRRGETETVLSRGWTDEMVASVAKASR